MAGLGAVLLAGCVDAVDEPACNGVRGLCERALDEVTFAGSHNAMSNADEGWVAPNQGHPIDWQLEHGVRAMLIDSYDWQGGDWLCHGNCALGATPLADFLTVLRAFLDGHPRDVVVLVVQDGLSVERTGSAFRAADLLDHTITLPRGGQAVWPTLGELVQADTRLLVTRESGAEGPAWYRPFYEVGFDTPYDFRTQEDMSCDLLRGSADLRMFLINHWLSTPLPTLAGASEVNQADALRERIAACTEAFGRPPSVVAVDHVQVGDLMEVVGELNARGG